MPLKDIKQLAAEIDAAVHANGPTGKTTATGLNSVLKSLATELIAHERQAALASAQKADLDAGGRVPGAQLPSYVDDILEATTYAALPTSGEAGKVYVTLDTNKQFRWSGSGYAQLSDSGLTTSQLAAVQGATTSPSAANPFVTAADLPANEKKIKAIRVVSATRERLFYTGLGTAENPGADGLKMALAAAQPGDTVQQITNANLPGIVGSNVASANGEQVRVPRGVNYDTGGFDIDTLAMSDGITLIGGTGVVHGRNATIYNSRLGTWGIGWFRGDTLDYRVYDLHIHTGVDGHEDFATPAAIYLPGARLYHRGNIYSEALWGIGGIVADTYCEHEGTLTLGRTCTGFLVDGGRAVQRGDVKVTANAAAGLVKSGHLEMYGGVLDLRAAQARAGFELGAGAVLELTDVTVLGMLPAYALKPNQVPAATVRLYGDTVVPAGAWEAGLLIEDYRPAAGAATAINREADVRGANGVCTAYTSAEAAFRAAGSGDIVNVYGSQLLPAPSDSQAILNLHPGVSANFYGVTLTSPAPNCDIITFRGGRQVLNGFNSTVTQRDTNASGGWFIGTYGDAAPVEAYIYDLHLQLTTYNSVGFALFGDGTYFYRGNVSSAGRYVVRMSGANAQRFTAYGNLTQSGGGTMFLMTNPAARLEWNGDITMTDSCYMYLKAGIVTLREGILHAESRTPGSETVAVNAGAGTIILENYTVLGIAGKTVLAADKVILRGNTVVVGNIQATTLVDERPAAAGVATAPQGQYLQISSTPAARVAELPLPARYTLADEVLDLNATAITYQLDKNTRTGPRQYGAPNQALSEVNAQLAALTDAELAAGAKLYVRTTPGTNAPSTVGLTLN